MLDKLKKIGYIYLSVQETGKQKELIKDQKKTWQA